MNYMGQDTSKVHVWVGINYDPSFDNYFELDDSGVDVDDTRYKICGFCKDIAEKWYDEDWIGVVQSPVSVDLDTLLGDELSVSDITLADIKKKCVDKGLKSANAMFYYIDALIEIKDKDKDYNSLFYIGAFDTDL